MITKYEDVRNDKLLEMLKDAQRKALNGIKVTGYTLLPADTAAGDDTYILHTDTPKTSAADDGW